MTPPVDPHQPANGHDRALVNEAPKDAFGDDRRVDRDAALLGPTDEAGHAAAGDLPQASVDLTIADPPSAPAMPNERDEAVGMTDGIASHRVEKAYDDVEAGRQDTSRAVETDRAYQRQKEAG